MGHIHYWISFPGSYTISYSYFLYIFYWETSYVDRSYSLNSLLYCCYITPWLWYSEGCSLGYWGLYK